MFPPSFHRQLNEEKVAEIRKETELFVDRQRIPMKAFVPPKDSSFGEAWFRFPRPEIKPGQRLRFATLLHTPRRMKVEVEFETDQMVFKGKLEY